MGLLNFFLGGVVFTKATESWRSPSSEGDDWGFFLNVTPNQFEAVFEDQSCDTFIIHCAGPGDMKRWVHGK